MSGALPPGLTLSSSGVISGIPSSTGVFSFTVRVTDAAAHTSEKEVSLIVNNLFGGLVGFRALLTRRAKHEISCGSQCP